MEARRSLSLTRIQPPRPNHPSLKQKSSNLILEMVGNGSACLEIKINRVDWQVFAWKTRSKRPDRTPLSKQKSSQILTRFVEIQPSLTSIGFHSRKIVVDPNQNRLNPWFSEVGDKLASLPPESSGSVLDRAQTRPGPTHGQP